MRQFVRRLPRLFLILGVSLTASCSNAPAGDPGETVGETSQAAQGCKAADSGDSQYLFCSGPLSHEQAAQACEAASMSLATIDDKEENVFVTANLAGQSYVGLSDTGNEGAWRWDANDEIVWCGDDSGNAQSPSSFTNWGTGHPAATSCEHASAEGRDYWLCSSKMGWDAAAATCASAGGQLASISSAAENAFLAARMDSPLWIGGRWAGSGDTWKWAESGEAFWQAGGPYPTGSTYTNWDVSPSGHATRPCAAMENGSPGTWTNHNCAELRGFICEAPASPDAEQPDRADCTTIATDGTWRSSACDVPRAYVCEATPKEEVPFSKLVPSIRDDYRTGKRRIHHAELAGELTDDELFARFPEAFGMRPCVDSWAALGEARILDHGMATQAWQQTYRGLPVYTRGYEVQSKLDEGPARSLTGQATHDIDVDTTPVVTETDAIAAATHAVKAKPSDYVPLPSGKLVVFPEGFGPKPTWRLAWMFTLPPLEDVGGFVIAVGADAPDVLMVSGQAREACGSINLGTLGGTPPPASIEVNAFQQMLFGDPNTAAAVATGNADFPFALLSYNVDPDPSGPAHTVPLLYATCPGQEYPMVTGLTASPVSVTAGADDAALGAALFMSAERAIVANAAVFRRADGLPWVGLDGAGLAPVHLQLQDFSFGSSASYTPHDRKINLKLPNLRPAGAAIETVAHELAHGIEHRMLTPVIPASPEDDPFIMGARGANPEARAIEEGFADILSEIAEIHHRGVTAEYAFCFDGDVHAPGGRECTRDMQTPSASSDQCRAFNADGVVVHMDCPADYRGPDWAMLPMCPTLGFGCLDPHRHSTILSHWFYLLSMGDTGTSALSCGYSVPPLDPDPSTSARLAARLVFDAIRDRRESALESYPAMAQATIDVARAGLTEAQVRSVVEAWFAVNVIEESFYEELAASLEPAREELQPYPWATFVWPAPEATTSWDIQIANGPFRDGASVVYERFGIGELAVRGGKIVGIHQLALPVHDNTRWFWRVRPHSEEPWLDCHPIHAFRGTGEPWDAAPIELSGALPDGTIPPGRVHVSFDRVKGATAYRVQIADHDTACMPGGDGVIEEIVEADDDDDVYEVARRSAFMPGVQPSRHYWVMVQPIGPEDGIGSGPHLGECSKLQFDSGSMPPPSPMQPEDGHLFNYHAYNEELQWQSNSGATEFRVYLYARDEAGICTDELITLFRPDAGVAPTHTLDGLGFSGKNPTGYCWEVTAVSASGEESPPSTRKFFGYFINSVSPVAPGIDLYQARENENPAPIAGDSYGSPVTFSWHPEPATAAYMLKVAQWPWATEIGTFDPLNGEGLCAPWSCGTEGTPVTYRDQVSGTSVELEPSLAAEGRYCWKAWPLVEEPGAPGVVATRQPVVGTQSVDCYTTGPAKPEIHVTQPGSVSVGVQSVDAWPPLPHTHTSAETQGFIRLPYVPDGQYEVFANAAYVEFGPDCVPAPEAAPFEDVKDCEIPFHFVAPMNQSIVVQARTWNSASRPPVRDSTTLVHNEFLYMSTGPCGQAGQQCCDEPGSECTDPGTACDGLWCVGCGAEGDACCPGNTCSAGNGCADGVCRPRCFAGGATYTGGPTFPSYDQIMALDHAGPTTVFVQLNSGHTPRNVQVWYEGALIGQTGCCHTLQNPYAPCHECYLLDATQYTADLEGNIWWRVLVPSGTSTALTLRAIPNCCVAPAGDEPYSWNAQCASTYHGTHPPGW